MKPHQTVMIVDDDDDDRFCFKEAITEIDPTYRCLEAKDGIEALARLRVAASLPDCIFMDINMPRMDGHQCLKELKDDAKLKNIPVVIYTTSSYKRDIDLAYRLGAADFLVKPVDVFSVKTQILKGIGKAETIGHAAA